MTNTKREQDRRDRRTAAYVEHYVHPASPEESNFRHGHWQQRRSKVRQALARCGANDHALNRFDQCGSTCSVEWSDTLQRYRLRGSMCKHRHCEPCQKAKAGLIANNLREKIAGGQRNRFRFITLTLKHTQEPLARQIAKLYSCFKSLRKTALWRHSQKGGAYLLEVKWTGSAWHPHLHLASEGLFINKFELSAMWLHVTKDSSIVDVQLIDKANDLIHYVTKYITKSTSPEVWNTPALADEFLLAMKGVRSCATFGTWRGYKLLQKPPIQTDWRFVGTLTTIIRRARGGDQSAWIVLKALKPPNEPIEID